MNRIKFADFGKIGVEIALFASLLATGGCHTTEITFDRNLNRNEGDSGLKADRTLSHASLGFGIYEYTRPETVSCSSAPPEQITIEMDPVDAIVHFFIGGIYTARKIHIYCPH